SFSGSSFRKDDAKMQIKASIGLFSFGLLATAGCLKPPPGSGAGPAPGSAASIGGGATAPAAESAPAPAPSAPSSAAHPAAPAVAGAPIGNTGFKECTAEGLIDDGEDGNNQ